MKAQRRFRGYQWSRENAGTAVLLSAADYHEVVRVSGRIEHSFWALDCCLEAENLVRVYSASKGWRVRPAGLWHLYPPHTPYWEDHRGLKRSAHSYYICFQGDVPAALLEQVEHPDHFAQLDDPQRLLVPLIERMADAGQRRGEDGFYPAQAAFYEVLDLLVHAQHIRENLWQIVAAYVPADPGDLVAGVREFIRGHLHRPVSLAEIARYAKVSVSTLSHRYREATGQTPLMTHEELRMNQIRHLLLKGEPLKVIAALHGFKDIYHLSKFFKRLQGVSPRGFLRESLAHS